MNEKFEKKQFKIIWKKITNKKEIKPTYKEEIINDKKVKTKIKGYIYPMHHLIYNVIRGLPKSRGFKEDSEGYKSLLNLLTPRYEYTLRYSEKELYEPFKEYFSKEEYLELIELVKKS